MRRDRDVSSASALELERRKLASLREGTRLAWRWMEANGIPLPRLEVVSDLRGDVVPLVEGKPAAGCYFGSRERRVVINLPQCCLGSYAEVLKKPILQWERGIADWSPLGVLCHEVGHHVDRHLGLRAGRSWVSSRRDWQAVVESEAAVTTCEDGPREAFAEATRLLQTNPRFLEVGRPLRWRYLTEELGLIPSPRVSSRKQRRLSLSCRKRSRELLGWFLAA